MVHYGIKMNWIKINQSDASAENRFNKLISIKNIQETIFFYITVKC